MRYAFSLLALIMLVSSPAQAYLVRKPASLNELTAGADLIFKGTVLSSRPAMTRLLSSVAGFEDLVTRFRIVSTIKGRIAAETVSVHHYDIVGRSRPPYAPEYYHFAVGRNYLVFATGTATGAFQLSTQPSATQSEGAFLCADDTPVSGNSVREIVWSELNRMLRSNVRDNVIYAIGQLDAMSGGGGWRNFFATTDFSREAVTSAVHTFVNSADPAVAQAAIGVIGSHNPYMLPRDPELWLATVGSTVMPNMIETQDPTRRNTAGESYWRELAGVADREGDDAVRAQAVLALGLVRQAAIEKQLERWLADASAAVRASATILLADYPNAATHARLAASARDIDPHVRASAALAVGYGQYATEADILSDLLHDADADVRKSAAMSLSSFSPRYAGVAAVLRANLNSPEFAPVFLNALASEDPSPYLDGLANEVNPQSPPRVLWSGEAPAQAARDILLRYLQAAPVGDVVSGKYDRYLDALERTGPFLSSDRLDMYDFYIQRGMTARAQRLREKAVQSAPYNIGATFEEIDRSPWAFTKHWPSGSDPDPVKYTLESTTKYATVGNPPGFRVSVTNLSSHALQHVIRPGTLASVLRIDGSATAIPIWWFQENASQPYVFDLAPDEQKYIYGDASAFVTLKGATLSEPGYLNVRYCDNWLVHNAPREICSNEIQIRVSPEKQPARLRF